MPEISVIIPAYNESSSITKSIKVIHSQLLRMDVPHEILIVDDGSQDGTAQVCHGLVSEEIPIKVVRHRKNGRLGCAIYTGLRCATKEMILYTDSDLPVDYSQLPEALRLLETADLVIGYKRNPYDQTIRRIYSWGYNFLIRTCFGLRVKDINFPFKLFRKRVIDHLYLQSSESFIDAEILIQARDLGFVTRQIGCYFYTRSSGKSRLADIRDISYIPLEIFAYVLGKWIPLWRQWRLEHRRIIGGPRS